MTSLLDWLYHVGVSLFIGSIAIYCATSVLARNAELRDLLFARRIVRAGTLYVTVPALWLMVVAGAVRATSARASGALVSYAIFAAILVALTHLFVVPATRDCLNYARQSLELKRRISSFRLAYMKETIPGAVNLVLALWVLFVFH